jgi:hypothetical protein
MGRRAWIVLASLAFALVALEVGARMYLGERFEQGAWVGSPQAVCGRFDAELGWANRADTSWRIKGHKVTYDVSMNSAGHRGREHARAKPEGVLRILLLGDSTSWGWGVDDDQAFAHLVEQQLDVEVINLAVPGYSTDQQLLQLEREGWDWDPDLVLLGVVHNDLVALDFPEYHGMQKPRFERDADGAWGLTNSPVPDPEGDSRLIDKYALRRASTWLALAKLLLPPPPEYQRPNVDDPAIKARIDRYWDRLTDPESTVSGLFARMTSSCAERDVPLFAFVLPHLHDRYLYDTTALRPTFTTPPNGMAYLTHGSTQLGSAGVRLGFETFAVDQALLDAVDADEHLDCGDEHLNARGNQIVAGVVVDELGPAIEELRGL